uniref:Small ribosomal subunit protein uS10 domain-containing protein n=1 Tax=Timspurckia oligopyrenoides TaxID=708627 RepID=A0A7S1EPI7_9RHOD|mmetsp:Transcript_10761/g.19455  ORF Transcript_10761/g.19455 Transcript_10761/m.19455 type:complete len:210 (+) Transcript_10761:68-697(+)
MSSPLLKSAAVVSGEHGVRTSLRSSRGLDGLNRNFVYHFQSNDIRKWMINESMRRIQNVLLRGGAVLHGDVVGLRRRRKNWCVLRSPHIDKKSREHFEQVTHRREIRFSVPLSNEIEYPQTRELAYQVASRLPDNVAVKVEQRMPGLLLIPELARLMKQLNGFTPEEIQEKDHKVQLKLKELEDKRNAELASLNSQEKLPIENDDEDSD